MTPDDFATIPPLPTLRDEVLVTLNHVRNIANRYAKDPYIANETPLLSQLHAVIGYLELAVSLDIRRAASAPTGNPI